jgi:anti-anti-sigma factor
MQLQIRTIGQVTIITMFGDINWKTCGDIQAQISSQIHEGSKIVLDMSHVDSMSSAGFRMLLATYRELQAQQGELVLAQIPENLQDLMANTGFLQHFQTRDTVEEGIQALHGET